MDGVSSWKIVDLLVWWLENNKNLFPKWWLKKWWWIYHGNRLQRKNHQQKQETKEKSLKNPEFEYTTHAIFLYRPMGLRRWVHPRFFLEKKPRICRKVFNFFKCFSCSRRFGCPGCPTFFFPGFHGRPNGAFVSHMAFLFRGHLSIFNTCSIHDEDITTRNST